MKLQLHEGALETQWMAKWPTNLGWSPRTLRILIHRMGSTSRCRKRNFALPCMYSRKLKNPTYVQCRGMVYVCTSQSRWSFSSDMYVLGSGTVPEWCLPPAQDKPMYYFPYCSSWHVAPTTTLVTLLSFFSSVVAFVKPQEREFIKNCCMYVMYVWYIHQFFTSSSLSISLTTCLSPKSLSSYPFAFHSYPCHIVIVASYSTTSRMKASLM